MNDQKKIERFYLNNFFELLGEKPLDIHDTESPGFIIELQQMKVGIEITEFHSNLKGEKCWPRRLVEENWALLQKKIMNEVEKYKELKNTNGIIYFKKLEIPRKSDQKSFVDELIQLSLEMIKVNKQKIHPGSDYPILNKYVSKFYLTNAGCYITWDWNHNVSSIGISESELINAIRPKIEKAIDYLKRQIDELWLIVVSGTKLLQTMPAHLTERLNSFNKLERLLLGSSYKYVFIFQYQFSVIHKWPKWEKIGG